MPIIKLDEDTCIGCGLCESICPNSFKMEDVKAKVIKEKIAKLSCEKEAEDSCPVKAIEVID